MTSSDLEQTYPQDEVAPSCTSFIFYSTSRRTIFMHHHPEVFGQDGVASQIHMVLHFLFYFETPSWNLWSGRCCQELMGQKRIEVDDVLRLRADPSSRWGCPELHFLYFLFCHTSSITILRSLVRTVLPGIDGTKTHRGRWRPPT